jgi:hypothetical protein
MFIDFKMTRNRPFTIFFGAVILVFMLIFSGFLMTIPNLIAQSSNNDLAIPNHLQSNLDSQAILWSAEVDVKDDAVVLIPGQDQKRFETGFNKISLNVQVTDPIPGLSGFDNSITEELLIQDFEQIPTTSSSTSRIRRMTNKFAEVTHDFTRLPKHMLGSTERSGLKQTISIYNPTEGQKNYQVTFLVENPYHTILWNNKPLQLTTEPLYLDTEPYEIQFPDSTNSIISTYNWQDLINTGFNTETYAVIHKGDVLVQSTVTISISPKTAVELDPTYLVENVAGLNLYSDEEWANMGNSMAVGDLNNDSYEDLIFTAPNAWSGPTDDRFQAGEVYILLGKPRKNLGNYLNFSFSEDSVIYGESEESNLNEAILATGDINYDGFDDIVIGAPEAKDERGMVYVIFGKSNLKKVYDLSVSGDHDIKITGSHAVGETGASLAVGDINNDKFDDIIIGTPSGSFGTGINQREECGLVHVLFGNTTMLSSIRLKDDFNQYDMKIIGEYIEDRFGQTLESGDFNGDGIDDIVIGSPEMNAGKERNRLSAGYVNVIFGNQSFPKDWDMRYYENTTMAEMGYLNSNVSIMGGKDFEYIGVALEVADLNNDNYDDILIGSPVARGKTGSNTDLGQVFILYGHSNFSKPKLYDGRNMSRDGYIIYGKDDGDLFGSAIVARDVSGDGVKDIIVGAPGARGVGDDSDRTGETYVIYGTLKKKQGVLDNLLNDLSIQILYGKNKGEQVGYSVTSGDLDNDAKSEIIIGAPTADSANGSFFEVGRIDVIFNLSGGIEITHTKLELMDGGGSNGDICYAGNEHTFRVRVAHSKGIQNLEFTTLSIEPLGPNIQFRWFQNNNTFLEIYDRQNFASINSTASVSRKITNTIYELDFKIAIDFTYPAHLSSSCQLYSLGTNLSTPAAIDQYTNLFKVENDLRFDGELVVKGGYQGKLNEGDRVHSKESIIWTGIKVVYNGTTNIYPDDRYFDVTVWDDAGNSWADRYSSGEEILIESQADSNTDPSDIHTLNITGIPSDGKGLSVIKFEIKVEDTKVLFTNPTPLQSIWHNFIHIDCSITINDTSGWQINGSSIQYSISTSGKIEENFGPWISTGDSGEKMVFTSSVKGTFANGQDNYIRWRAKNVASALYSGSQMFRVRVDIEPVMYFEPIPDTDSWQYQGNVECKITVIDNLSGVDENSVEYRYKTADMNEYTSWSKDGLSSSNVQVNIELGTNGKQVTVAGYQFKVELNFKAGIENYIQWRGMDLLANSDLGSDKFRVKITTQKPIAILSMPINGITLENIATNLEWTGIDPNSDAISYDVYFSRSFEKVNSLDPSVRIAQGISKTEFDISELQNGGNYYWTVIPDDGNNIGECQSGIWSFMVVLQPPIAYPILPLNGSVHSTTEIEFIWASNYNGLEEVKFDLYMDTFLPPDNIIAQDITNSSFKYVGVENTKTYYWKVVPKVETLLGAEHGRSQPQLMEFTINQELIPPAVTLQEPKNEIFVTNQLPTLNWDLIYSGDDSENVTYNIILDESPKPTSIIASGLKTTSFTFTTPLKFNTTYYWQVLPNINELTGNCLSGVWSFHTVQNIPEFNLQLDLEKDELTMKPGTSAKIEFTVQNLGNLDDYAMLTLTTTELNKNFITIIPQNFELSTNEAGSGTIDFTIPQNTELKTYTITIIATSDGASQYGLNVQVKKDISITISETIKTDDGSEDFNATNIIFVIIIILLVILILYTVLRLSKTQKPKEEPKESDQTSKKDRPDIKSQDKLKAKSQTKKIQQLKVKPEGKDKKSTKK